jgi:hypothetical protein
MLYNDGGEYGFPRTSNAWTPERLSILVGPVEELLGIQKLLPSASVPLLKRISESFRVGIQVKPI